MTFVIINIAKMKNLLIILFVGVAVGCSESNNSSESTKNTTNDIVTNKNYDWIGEMKIYSNYWVEAHHNTIDSKFIIYLTQHNNINRVHPLDSIKIDATSNDWVDFGTVMHNGVVDSEIIVKVNQENDSSESVIIEAWRANLESQKIEPISIDNLTVEKYD